ncbi:hypothetical protein E2562_032325 [Oryza meyeriana var. granulata]|uniref:Uncharacterized protein n=1 Tax=Oryza meyeriana var. granulata TaxID=110450 RepID=A0A6G1E489_9ORYZ|nr:hypothetical protein E2562_032325 [Oryza meyeriana var. granulata]
MVPKPRCCSGGIELARLPLPRAGGIELARPRFDMVAAYWSWRASSRPGGQDLEGTVAAWRRSAGALRGCLLELEPRGQGRPGGASVEGRLGCWILEGGRPAAGQEART